MIISHKTLLDIVNNIELMKSYIIQYFIIAEEKLLLVVLKVEIFFTLFLFGIFNKIYITLKLSTISL